MSYYYSEKLDLFADLATNVSIEGHQYWDTADPENLEIATRFFNEELGFLSGREKEELLDTWQMTLDDARYTKILFNSIKVLKDKYYQEGNNGFSETH